MFCPFCIQHWTRAHTHTFSSYLRFLFYQKVYNSEKNVICHLLYIYTQRLGYLWRIVRKSRRQIRRCYCDCIQIDYLVKLVLLLFKKKIVWHNQPTKKNFHTFKIEKVRSIHDKRHTFQMYKLFVVCCKSAHILIFCWIHGIQFPNGGWCAPANPNKPENQEKRKMIWKIWHLAAGK